MLKFAIKNLLTRKSKFIITIIAILISTMIILFSYNLSNQINDGLIGTATYYDVVVGPNGSSTDLVLSSMFFTGTITDTIDNETYNLIKEKSDITTIIPIATGDNYRGSKIIGTRSILLDGKKLSQGRMFEENFEVVIGSELSQKYNLRIGDTLLGSHGVSESAHIHDNAPYKIVGILEKTYTVYDKTIFTNVHSVWAVHGHNENEVVESGEHEHEHEGEYTALLLKTKNPSAALNLINEINELPGVLAVNPSQTLRELLKNVDTTTTIVYVLCAVIAIMSFVIIYMITLMTMQDLKKDIVLMRLLGLKQSTIFKIVMIQNTLISLAALVISFILTRVSLYLANNITSAMGVVMNHNKIYGGEYLILILVLFISVLPVIFNLIGMFRSDLENEK